MKTHGGDNVVKDNPNIPSAAAMQAVAAVIAFATPIYAAVGVELVKFGISDPEPVIPPDRLSGLGLFLIVAGISGAAASFLVRRLVAPRILAQDQSIAGRFRVTIIAMSVAETPGIIGLIYAFLSNSLGVPFVLWGVSLAASIAHFPTRAWLEGGTRNQ